MNNPLEVLGYSPEEIEEALQEERTTKKPYEADYRVCMCGHAARSHSSEGISELAKYKREHNLPMTCTTGKMKCPCAEFDPVLTSTKIRVFTFKTMGTGLKHALPRGVEKARAMGGEIVWLKQPACRVCGRMTGRLTIAAIDMFGASMKTSANPCSENVFLCEEHLPLLGGVR